MPAKFIAESNDDDRVERAAVRGVQTLAWLVIIVVDFGVGRSFLDGRCGGRPATRESIACHS